MKHLLIILIFTSAIRASAQKQIQTTEQFSIEGLIKKSVTIKLSDLSVYQQHSSDSVVITNHLMEKKSTLFSLKGVLLKDILNKVMLLENNPRLLSEFYFTCIATDGYKVVFSWNELFNSKIGDSVFILTAHGGKEAASLSDRIALISPSDIATGRRYVKSLSKIIVGRVP